MSLYESIEAFIQDGLWPEMTAYARKISADSGCPEILLEMIPTPRLEAYAHREKATIFISHGWLLRLCLVLEVIQSMWKTRDSRPQVIAVNIQSAWDTYFFFKPEESLQHTFLGAPDLAPLLLDEWDEAEHADLLQNFTKTFKEKNGGGPGALNFELSDHISEEVVERVKVAALFLVAHELAHFSRSHFDMLSDLGRGKSEEYMRKAIEVDADGWSLNLQISERLALGELDVLKALSKVLEPAFVCISMMDLGRRSSHQSEIPGSTHPLADMRALCAIEIALEMTGRTWPGLDTLLRRSRDTSILWAARSFQFLGIGAGAFYVVANRFWTLDDQFTSELLILAMLREERLSIETAWRIMAYGDSGSTPSHWPMIWPFMRTEDESRKCAAEFVKIMVNRENAIESLDDTKERWVRILKEARGRFHLREHDNLMTYNDLEMASPFLHIRDGEISYEGIGQEWHDKYRRIMSTAMDMLFKLAEVKITKS